MYVYVCVCVCVCERAELVVDNVMIELFLALSFGSLLGDAT